MALDPLTAGIDLAGKVLDKLFPNPEERAAAELKLQQLQQSGQLAQIEVNKAEAANASVFVAGWRPAVGWVCAAAFAYHYVIQPFLAFLFAAAGKVIPLPVFDIDSMMYVLGGMLGLGGMRSVEKVKGVTTGLAGKLPWAK